MHNCCTGKLGTHAFQMFIAVGTINVCHFVVQYVSEVIRAGNA